MNNKGFTMVEILGVVVIMGILMAVAVGAVSLYRDRATNQAYDTLAKSASGAAANYIMDYPDNKGAVLLEDLHDDQYIERPADPNNENKDCEGVVVYNKTSGTGDKIDSYDYKVHLCCSNYARTYHYPSGTVTEIEDKNYCSNLNNIDTETGEIKAAPSCTIELSGEKNASGEFTEPVDIKLKTKGSVTGRKLSTSSDPGEDYDGVTNVIHSDNGTVTYYGHVKNAYGESSCSQTFTKNGTGPAVTLSNDSNGNWTKGPVKITISSNDPKGIEKVEYGYDKETWYSHDWTNQSADLTNVLGTWTAERNQKVYIKVTSKSGNYTIKETTVKIDKTPPEYIAIGMTCGSHPDGYKRYLTIVTTDSGSGIKSRNLSWSWYNSSKSYVGGSTANSSNFGGWARLDDGLWDTAASAGTKYISFSQTTCDMVGNCASKTGDMIPKEPPVCS